MQTADFCPEQSSPIQEPSEEESGNANPHKWSHAMEVIDEIRRNTAAPGTLQARFSIPATEILLDTFMCALKENFLLQGCLYIFPHFVAFGCDIPGHSRSIVMSISDVDCVKKAKLALLPNSIEISALERTYHFASFLHRGKAYEMIYNLWAVDKSLSALANQRTKIVEQDVSMQG
jgi:hypothetical protein